MNLFRYHTNRKRLIPGLSLWCQNERGDDSVATFNKLASYFGTVLTDDPTVQGGTFPVNVKPGLDKYFRELGLTATYAVTQYHDTDETEWLEMKHWIDFGDPFIYCVNGHYVYDNHAVLAIGYVQYNYDWYQENSKSRSSHYLQVVDGKSMHADRYINVDVGHSTDEDEMITLYFRYSYGHK